MELFKRYDELQLKWKILLFFPLLIVSLPIVVFAVFKEMFSSFDDYSRGGRSDYHVGSPLPIVRPESYRKLKRRNRLMRKYSHKGEDKSSDNDGDAD